MFLVLWGYPRGVERGPRLGFFSVEKSQKKSSFIQFVHHAYMVPRSAARKRIRFAGQVNFRLYDWDNNRVRERDCSVRLFCSSLSKKISALFCAYSGFLSHDDNTQCRCCRIFKVPLFSFFFFSPLQQVRRIIGDSSRSFRKIPVLFVTFIFFFSTSRSRRFYGRMMRAWNTNFSSGLMLFQHPWIFGGLVWADSNGQIFLHAIWHELFIGFGEKKLSDPNFYFPHGSQKGKIR